MGRQKVLSPEHLKRLDDLKIKKWTATMLDYIWRFYGLQAVAAAVIIVGIYTEHWYDYDNTQALSSIAGSPVDYLEEWNMGTKSIAVYTQYCVVGASDCTDDK